MNCDYGCGNEAKYLLKNGKHCCCAKASQCPVNRKKNSDACKVSYQEGKKKNNKWNGSDDNLRILKEASTRRILKQMDEAFVEHSKVSNESINNYLFNYKHWPHKCSRCNLEEWQGQQIPLELHHKNGNSRDNRIENLEYLCLNCHAITSNFRGKNINTGKTKITDEELEEALISNKSVRKALLSVGLAPKGGNYNRAYKLLEKIKNSQKKDS